MKIGYSCAVSWALVGVIGTALCASAQTAYQPKFAGDPAHSDSEALALGYMRTVLRAQRLIGTYRHFHPAHGQPRSRRLHRQFPSPQGRI
jgi:hypothetical protein